MPPRPDSAIRVGVTGHRVPPKLPGDTVRAIEETVGKVLDAIMAAAGEVRGKHADVFARIMPTVETRRVGPHGTATPSTGAVVVSSLAEGADQIVAYAGLAKGWRLDAVLPFSAGEYANDFEAPETALRFAELSRRARHTFVLPGSRENPARAYEAAGVVMLASSDILIAVWNGEAGGGRGGTAEIVARAVADGMPVVVIDPAVPNAATIRWIGFKAPPPVSSCIEDMPQRPLDELGIVIAAILAPFPRRYRSRAWNSR